MTEGNQSIRASLAGRTTPHVKRAMRRYLTEFAAQARREFPVKFAAERQAALRLVVSTGDYRRFWLEYDCPEREEVWGYGTAVVRAAQIAASVIDREELRGSLGLRAEGDITRTLQRDIGVIREQFSQRAIAARRGS